MKAEAGKGKILGIFNGLDIIIMIFVIAAIFLGIRFLKSRDAVAEAGGNKTIQYTVEAQNVVKAASEMAKAGDEVYNSSTSDYLGTVTEVRVIDQTRLEYNQTKGVYEKHPVPRLYTVYVTIEGDGYETDQNIVVNGQTVKVGGEMSVKGKGYAFGGYIVGIHVQEAQDTGAPAVKEEGLGA